jgi:hypothetical protein
MVKITKRIVEAADRDSRKVALARFLNEASYGGSEDIDEERHLAA